MKSLERLEEQWKKALAEGTCFIGGCDLNKKTCWHLDKFLTMTTSTRPTKGMAHRRRPRDAEVGLTYVEWVEETPDNGVEPVTTGVWELFKRLRKYGLGRDQIGILIRRLGYGMTFKDIKEEMHWTDYQSMYGRYRTAIRTIKRKAEKR